MSSFSLKDKINNLFVEKGINKNEALRFYMYERFLERLSISVYKDNFILKGGYYLSTLFGINSRTTNDIEASLKNQELTKENINKMIKEIICVDMKDNALISLKGIKEIRNEDQYGGYRVTLLTRIDNIQETFHFDIATGDIITPCEIRYKYKTILGDKTIKLWAYNLETVLAEKIETIMSRSVLSSRMKDYYDVYLIINLKWKDLDFDNLKKAIIRTLSKRESLDILSNPYESLDNIMLDRNLNSFWKSYQRKNKFVSTIQFEDTVKCIRKVIELVIDEQR